MLKCVRATVYLFQNILLMDSECCTCSIANPNDSTAPPKSFTFDSVYSVVSTTEQIYNDIVYPLVEVTAPNCPGGSERKELIPRLVCRECWRGTIPPSSPTAKPAAAKATPCRACPSLPPRGVSFRGPSNTSSRRSASSKTRSSWSLLAT